MDAPRQHLTKSPRRGLSRRELLRTGAAGLCGAAVSACTTTGTGGSWPAESAGQHYIDAHSHVWTRDVAKFPLAKGVSVAELDPPSFTAEELLAVARPQGVGRVVLIQHSTYQGYDNSYMIDAARRHPGVFSIVAVIDETAPRPQDTMRRLARQGVRGFRITSWRDPQHWLDGPAMAAMWRCAAEDGLAMCPLIDPPVLDTVDRMCARFPDTPVVVDHLARIGVDGNIRDDDVSSLCKLARHKHTRVKVSAFYALGKKTPPYLDLAPMIRRVYDAFGPQRLMWASDCPYQLNGGQTYADSIALVRDRLDFLTATDRQWLLRQTAQRVFFAGI